MQEPIISVSGLRGILGLSLSPETISRYVTAFVEQLPEGSILLSRDGRPSGWALGNIVKGTINLLGRDVIDVGVAATPTVGILVRENRCTGGIQISASHNPPEYNGIKLMGADGRVISAEKGAQVKSAYKDQPVTWAPWDEIGSTTTCDDTTTAHIEKILATITAKPIEEKKFKVLLDSNGGSGSIVGVKLLEKLGCEVEVLGGEPNGEFLHPAEPTEANLKSISELVAKGKYDVAFCQDPDADRLAVIDEKGRYIGEEYTVALCLQNVLSKHKGPVVINGATSRMNEDVALSMKCPIFRSAVGEANVTQEMLLRDAVFGGEGNGGPIDPQVGYIRDSFVGMANILELMAKKKKSIGKLADALPRYEIVKHKVDLDPQELPGGFDRLKHQYADAMLDEGDGLRFTWKDRWLIARASNTEPIVRVIAESKSFDQSEDMCISATRTLRGVQRRGIAWKRLKARASAKRSIRNSNPNRFSIVYDLSPGELLREFQAKYGYFVTFACILVVPAVVMQPNRLRLGQFQVADLLTVILFFATMCAITPTMVELNWWLEPSVFALASVFAGVFGGYVAKEKIWAMIVPTWGFLWGIFVPDLIRYFG